MSYAFISNPLIPLQLSKSYVKLPLSWHLSVVSLYAIALPVRRYVVKLGRGIDDGGRGWREVGGGSDSCLSELMS